MRQINRDVLANGLLTTVKNKAYPGYARIAALFTYKQLLGKDSAPALIELVQDAEMREYALRAMADRKSQLANVPIAVYSAALTDKIIEWNNSFIGKVLIQTWITVIA